MAKKKTPQKKMRVSHVILSMTAVLCLFTYCSEGTPAENIPEATEQSEPDLSRDFIYSLREQINETTPETMPESIPETVPESISETVPESIPETVLESIPETMPESIPETVPESISETMPESMPETMPESMPETVTQPEITILHADSSMTAELISELKGIAVFWAPTGNKIHMNPDCRSFKKGYTYAGTYDEALSVRTDDWCGICSKGADGAISSNGHATSDVLASCYTYSDYLNQIPSTAFD